MIQLNAHSDSIGALSSALCMIHCLATPFLFVAQSCSATCCEASPMAWRLIDVAFLAISFYAIVPAWKIAGYTWVKAGMLVAWLILSLIILNSHLQVVSLSEKWIYLPALSLVVLHLYNRKNCKCQAKCCD